MFRGVFISSKCLFIIISFPCFIQIIRNRITNIPLKPIQHFYLMWFKVLYKFEWDSPFVISPPINIAFLTSVFLFILLFSPDHLSVIYAVGADHLSNLEITLLSGLVDLITDIRTQGVRQKHLCQTYLVHAITDGVSAGNTE